jgi:hypothetical protein
VPFSQNFRVGTRDKLGLLGSLIDGTDMPTASSVRSDSEGDEAFEFSKGLRKDFSVDFGRSPMSGIYACAKQASAPTDSAIINVLDEIIVTPLKECI